mgnify:CR=1 FL=1
MWILFDSSTTNLNAYVYKSDQNISEHMYFWIVCP